MELHSSQPPPLRAFLLLLFLSISLLPPSSAQLNHEALALLSFKSSIAQDPHASMATWNSSSGGDHCSWNGITCSEGKVVSISLPKSSLLGSLPPSLGSLSSLRHVNLRSNRLRGALPSGLFAAGRLQSLVLSGNSFVGPIPPELGRLRSLQILDLSQNSLDGAIPASISQCARLEVLDLSHNGLTSSVPFGLGANLTALEKMNLSFNRLNGSLPRDLGNLSSIRGTLDLSHNLFSGPIPPTLGNLPENVYVDVSFNNLSGSIPRDGSLVNRGSTAFLGNPNLCGPPLEKPCPPISGAAPSNSSKFPSLPTDDGSFLASERGKEKGRNGLSKTAVVAIVVSDVVAVGLMAMLFFYCYWKAVSSKTKEASENADDDSECGKNYFCCGCDESKSNTERAVEQFHLISLDKQVLFDMDSLLKGSAYVMERSEIGVMYRVVLEDGLTLLIRRLSTNRSQSCKEFEREVEAISRVRHPNIVLLRAYYWSVAEKLLIYDYIPNGNLSHAIHGNAASTSLSPLSWHHRLKIMKGIAKGLAFLHEFSPRKYVHGDLNPNNILLGFDMEPYISGFGLGHLTNMESTKPSICSDEKTIENQQTPISNGSISPIWSNSRFYQAPEALKSFKPSQKWDVYSFGAILLELISGRSSAVLMDTLEMDLVHWVQISIEGQRSLLHVVDPYLTREWEREDEITTILKLALTCVQLNPQSRPSMRHVVDLFDNLNL